MKNNTAGYLPPVPHHANQTPAPAPASKATRTRKGLAAQCPPKSGRRVLRREIPSDRVGHRKYVEYRVIPREELSVEQRRRTAAMNVNRGASRSKAGFMPTRPIGI